MEAVVKWALGFVDSLPPIPASNILVFVVLLLAVLPLARKAFRSPPEISSHEPQEAYPMVLLQASSVYTVLTDIQISLQRVNERLAVCEQMLRRRQKPVRNRRKKPAPAPEVE